MMRPTLATAGSLAFVIALLVSFATQANAICTPDLRVCAEFFESDAVFVGTVTSVRYWPEGLQGSDPGLSYALKVRRVYRGPATPIIRVFSERNSGGYYLDVGSTYLLFASESRGQLEIGCGGNSGKLPQAQATVDQLEELVRGLKHAKGGDIGGRVIGKDDDKPVAGIPVVVKGAGKSYRGRTGPDGWFHIRVPAGEYSVVVSESPPWSVRPIEEEYGYANPEKVRIVDGSCADLSYYAEHPLAAHAQP
jgi:Carboxypeptidase regulatory-like domain